MEEFQKLAISKDGTHLTLSVNPVALDVVHSADIAIAVQPRIDMGQHLQSLRGQVDWGEHFPTVHLRYAFVQSLNDPSPNGLTST